MPPRVALTYRDPLRYVIAEAARRGLVDAVEVVPSGYAKVELGALLRRRLADLGLPFSFHFVDGSLGSADFADNNHCARTRELLQGFSPLFVSDHLTAHRAGDLDLEVNLPVVCTEEAVEVYADNVRRFVALVEPPAPFLLEHVPAYWGYAADTLSPAETYRRVVERAGCGVLLDLHNLYVDERNRGFDPVAFIEALPPGAVREIHLAGGHQIEGTDAYLDGHDARVPDRVYALLEVALAHARPELVVLEREHRFRDPDDLLRELERIHEALA